MNYDAWLPDDMEYELAYDDVAFNPYYRYDGFYDPRYYRDFRYRRPYPHPHHRRFRHQRRYW